MEEEESHYTSKKNRVFVRGVEGAYSLGDELAKLRAMPRVRRAKDLKFNEGPQAFSRHYVQPKNGITQTFHIHRGIQPGRSFAEARACERSGVLYPGRPRL